MAASRLAATATSAKPFVSPVNLAYPAVSGAAPAGSRNRPPAMPSASYPVVPAHFQSGGSSSVPVRIFSVTTQAPPVALASRSR